jgi:hypothetical protein
MIGFIDHSLYNISLNYKPYNAIADLHTFQFTVAHPLGFSVTISRILATDLNTGTITSNWYEAFFSFLLQSPWITDTTELDPNLQFYQSSLVYLQADSRYTDVARTTQKTPSLARILCYLATSCNIIQQRTRLPLLRVGTCLLSRCLASLWENPPQYFKSQFLTPPQRSAE